MNYLGLPGLPSDFVSDNLTTLLLVCSSRAQIGADVNHGVCVECLAAAMPSVIVDRVQKVSTFEACIVISFLTSSTASLDAFQEVSRSSLVQGFLKSS